MHRMPGGACGNRIARAPGDIAGGAATHRHQPEFTNVTIASDMIGKRVLL
jgi:hypothetical protein